MFWRPMVGRVSTTWLTIAAHGQARLRVEGKAYGFVRAGRTRRWAWGAFDETFVVRPVPGQVVIDVVATGPFARARVRVQCASVIDVAPPALVHSSRSLRSNISAPRVRRLATRRFFGPRVVHLTKVPQR